MSSLTATTVSRVLAKRHTRSASLSGRVRGYRSNTRGFTATGTGVVTVEHHTGNAAHRPTDKADTIGALHTYAATLRDAGFNAEVIAPHGESADHRVLRVTKGA